MSKPSSSHPTNLKSISKIWPWSNLLASPPLMNVYPWKVILVLFFLFIFLGSCFCFKACNSDVKCTSQAMCVVALLCHMEVSIAIVIMGLSPWLWMVSFMENPPIKSINGWFGATPMTMETPTCSFRQCSARMPRASENRSDAMHLDFPEFFV